MTTALTKEQVLQSRPRNIRSIEIEGLGVVGVRELNVAEQCDLESELDTLDASDVVGYAAVRLAFLLCDESGAPLLTLSEAREHTGSLPANVVAALLSARTGSVLNG